MIFIFIYVYSNTKIKEMYLKGGIAYLSKSIWKS